MSKFYICTEAFVVTVYDSPEDEAKAQRYGSLSSAELQELVEKKDLVVPRGEDKWFRTGQRVHENHLVFQGESGHNRRLKLFVPEDEEAPEPMLVGAEPMRRGPGRPRKTEVTA